MYYTLYCVHKKKITLVNAPTIPQDQIVTETCNFGGDYGVRGEIRKDLFSENQLLNAGNSFSVNY